MNIIYELDSQQYEACNKMSGYWSSKSSSRINTTLLHAHSVERACLLEQNPIPLYQGNYSSPDAQMDIAVSAHQIASSIRNGLFFGILS